MGRLKETIRMKTKRTSGASLGTIIGELNQTLRGWYGYFKHVLHWELKNVDQWVRRRLRNILRQRAKRAGTSRGRENAEYPNAYFAGQGLFMLHKTWKTERQSLKR
jgi:RNA-directed DNA polymerase